MNDKDFDKIFSKKLQEEKSMPTDERSWEALASQLDEHNRKKGVGGKNAIRLAWLIPLLLLLLGVNIWSLMKMNQTEKQNLILHSELKDVKTTFQKHDTIIQTQYIYKTDTIFINSNNTQKGDKNLSSTRAQSNTVPKFSTYTPLSQLTRDVPSVFQGVETLSESKSALNTAKTNDFINNNTDKIENKAIQKGDFETLKANTNQDILSNLPLLNGWVVEDKKAKPEIILLSLPLLSPPSPIIENKKINRFYIGSSAGFINYHTLWLNKDGLEIGRNEKSYQVGLKMEYALTSNWRITASADYCPYDFNIKWLDNRYNLPPTPNYYNPTSSTMNSIKGTQKLYLGSMGFKYVFNQNSRWRPYISTAYTAMRIEPYDAEYTFTHTATNRTYTNTTHLNGGADIINIGLLNGGIEYHFTKHLVLQADGFYYKDLNSIKKTYDLFGLRGAILVGF